MVHANQNAWQCACIYWVFVAAFHHSYDPARGVCSSLHVRVAGKPSLMASSSSSLLGRFGGKLSLKARQVSEALASSLHDRPAGKLSPMLSASEALAEIHGGSESSMIE